MATPDEAETKIEYPDKAKEGLCGTAFPAYDGKFYVPDGFEDISFANDWVSCPTIADKEAVLVIRQDYADPARRVMAGKRYRVDVCREELLEAGYEGVQPLFATNRFDEALAFAKEKIPELKDSIEEYIADERREKILSYSNHKTRNAYDDFYAKSHAVSMDMLAKNPIYLHRDDPTIEAAAMMLLEKKYNKSVIFRVFRDCSPLTTYPGEEDKLAKQILETIEKQGLKRYVTDKFLAHIAKQYEVAR